MPAEIRITASLTRGAVFYFVDEELTSSEPHYFVVLNQDPITDDYLILVVASSQIEKRVNFVKRNNFPSETLVFITPDEFSVFKKNTVIDCNNVFQKTNEILVKKLESENLRIHTEVLPETIILKLLKGVQSSHMVSDEVKDILS